ncbi:MAG: DNA-J related domain-containing protein [Marinagarivorans sp.]
MPALIHMDELIKAADLLVARLAVFFEDRVEPIREYELLTLLQTEGLLAVCEEANYWVALFRKHFFLRHCLYAVNKIIAEQGRHLLLGPVCIEVVIKKTSGCATHLPSEDTSYKALADYYGDLIHWINATEETCRSFVDDFFKRFVVFNEAEAHLTCLGLPKDAVWGVVQQRYRRLAQQHHPDKGGDAELFLTYTHAYEALKRLLAP